MSARIAIGQVDRPAAVRAVHRLHVLSKFGELLRRERPDKVLFSKKVKKRRQAAMSVGAAQVLEARGPLHVVRQVQPGMTTRALGEVSVGEAWARHAFADDAEQRQRRAGREADAFTLVEPERLARLTQIDGHGPAKMRR